ncbi:MFS transporter [Synoicihabitans lomoniglobus]|uniref:MFS transporter n=1 Tax=Synoicihabitans lomoniglobus TaxID=2909285 RepID=A0AAF0CRD5_9BACT|nr:MFS transporter [Opitutaceae bacterium LMO-M01]WED66669.1 MFS transporter [Opitutaceae bacterium LMO-M01]
MSESTSKFKVRGLRWYIVVLLCLASELNYLDRQTLSVLAQTIQDELGITTMQYANITSAFLISYTVMYAVCGRLVDVLGSRWSFLIFVTGWSLSNMAHAFARTAAQFSVCRFFLGATEPASFPGGLRAVTEWFPLRERAVAVGIFNAGTAIGAGIAAPLVSWIALSWGWRWAFIVGGALGLVWVVIWAFCYRLPRQHPWLKEAELAHIESDGDRTEVEPKAVPIPTLLKDRRAWGCFAARMLTDPISYFFIFWTPKFLQQERGFDLSDIGKYGWIPFVALALGNLSGGAIPGLLMRHGWSLNRARKTTMFVASCVMPLALWAIISLPSATAAVGMISVAMFAHAAWANMTLPAEVFPKHVVGSVTGFAGMFGGIVGILSQQAIGWTVQNVSFTPVFVVSAFMHLAAFTLVSILIGKLGVIRAPGSPSPVVA